MRNLAFLALLAVPCLAADWINLFNGKDLTGWQSVGDGVWTVIADGTLTGQRNPGRPPFTADSISPARYHIWQNTQAWLYTEREFGDFDLELDYWLRVRGNSGISLRDPSRGKYSIGNEPDFTRTPARLGYEIQLNNLYPDKHPSGSIYLFAAATGGAQKDNQWNHLRIESRKTGIRVLLNGKLVAEHAGDPKRQLTGPIGLQLHDQFSVAMFRNIRIREL